MYKRLEDIQKDLNVKSISAESESERLFQQLRRELRVHVADYEETIDQLRLDVHTLSISDSRPQVTAFAPSFKEPISPPKDPTLPPTISIEREKEPPAVTIKEVVLTPAEDNPLPQVLRVLESRVSVLERKTETRLPRKSTFIAQEVKATAEDHLSLQLPALFSSLSSLEARFTALEALPRPVPVDLSPLLLRLTTLENARKRIEPPARQTPLNFPPRKEAFSPKKAILTVNKDTSPVNKDISSVNKEVSPAYRDTPTTIPGNIGVDVMGREEIEERLSELEARLEEAWLPKPPDLTEVETDLRTTKAAISMMREELDFLSQTVATLRKSEPRFSHSLSPPSPDKAVGKTGNVFFNQAADTVLSLEARQITLSKEVEKMHSVLEGKMREMGETEQHVERTERLLQSTIERMHADMERKISALEEVLDRPADDSEATKNLSALRGVISKLQRDFKSLSATVSSLQSLPTTPTPSLDFEPPKQFLSVLQRQEGQIRSLEAGLRQLTKELESLTPSLKRQIESASAGRVAEMERLKESVEGVLGKVMEGGRLNRRDYELVKDLYDRVDQKADRTELPTKVDRVELQKAYAVLSKKLEVYREEAKKHVEVVLPVREEAAGTFKRLDVGCLSCGQEIKGEIEGRNATPGPVLGLPRYGHGFSKLLPMLNDLVTPLHKRGHSELQQICSTDRLRRAGSRLQSSNRTPLS